MNDILDFFIAAYEGTSTLLIILEAIAFVFGILSVWYAKKVNIWVSNRNHMHGYNGLFALYKPIFWRYDDEYLLFHYECLWMVELGQKKR